MSLLQRISSQEYIKLFRQSIYLVHQPLPAKAYQTVWDYPA
jgi:hypothetical protein